MLYGLPITAPCLAVVVLSTLSKHLGVLVLFYLAFRSTLGYWCCFVCCLTGAVWSTNHSPLSRCCCFIYHFEAPWVTGVVLSVVSLVLYGLPIKSPCLAVVVLSSLSKHLEVLVLFCLLSHWCCMVYQSQPLVSLLLFYLPFRSTLGYWCCFIYPFEAPWGTGVVLSVVSLVLYGLPITAPCLAVVVLSSLSKHLEVLVLFCLLSHWCCMVYQSKPLVSLLLFYLACRSTLGYWCCFVCCLTGAVWSTNQIPLSRCCCFI